MGVQSPSTLATLCNEKNTRFDLQSPGDIIMDAIKTSPPITVTKLFDIPTTKLWELISTLVISIIAIHFVKQMMSLNGLMKIILTFLYT